MWYSNKLWVGGVRRPNSRGPTRERCTGNISWFSSDSTRQNPSFLLQPSNYHQPTRWRILSVHTLPININWNRFSNPNFIFNYTTTKVYHGFPVIGLALYNPPSDHQSPPSTAPTAASHSGHPTQPQPLPDLCLRSAAFSRSFQEAPQTQRSFVQIGRRRRSWGSSGGGGRRKRAGGEGASPRRQHPIHFWWVREARVVTRLRHAAAPPADLR